MQSSSSASPIASTSQQGEGKSPNVNLSPPLAGPPLSQEKIRQKIIEILSGTANDCLQELGYHPTMPARLQELELRSKNWQNENLRLYQDNQRLLETVKAHNESMQMLHRPEAEKIQHIQKLEVENRTLRMQVEHHMKMKQGSNNLEQRYLHLQKEYSTLSEKYNQVYAEVRRLREAYGSVGNNPNQTHQHQHQDAFHLLQPQMHNGQISRTIPPPQPSFIQTQLPPGTSLRPVQGQHTYISSPGAVYVHGQQHTQRTAGQMTYSTDTQRRHTISTNQEPRGMQGSDVVSITQMQMMMQQQQYQQQQQRISHSSTMQGQIPTVPAGQMTSQSPQELNPDQLRHIRRASYPAHDHQLVPAYQHPSFQSTSSQVASSSPQTKQNLTFNPTQPQHLSAPGTLSLQQMVFDPAKMPTRVISNPSIFATSHSVHTPGSKILSSMSPPNANIPTARPSSTSSQNTPTGTQFTTYRSGTVTSGHGSPSPRSSSGHLKRESMSADLNDDTKNSNKKPKLETLDANVRTPTPPVSRTPSTPTLSSASETTGAPQNPEASSQMVEAEDDEEDIVQIGPDGLRLVEDILDQIYGNNRRGEVICWFCKNRFDKGFTTTPPKPFIGATDQELEVHCKEDHEDAWNKARASI